jgi:two-component system, NarL family, response regulator LiaR
MMQDRIRIILADDHPAVRAGHSALDPRVTERVIGKLDQPAATLPKGPERVSDRELEVLRLAARGQTNRGIGRELGISERTVHSHLTNIYAKLGVNTRTEAVLTALRAGWIALDDTTA